MLKLTQNLKSGKMNIEEVPFPALEKVQVLVRNHYSVISAGTEGKTVGDARKGYVGKALARQKEVKQVIETVKTEGPVRTFKLVKNKLEVPSALGYSCAGEVIALGEDVRDLKIGDLVACGGQGAHHADVVSVYRNLCVGLPEDINLKHAAFTTIGAIALQGVRQADLRIGESCVVIGLGLIGQLTIQILNASGVRTIGIDIEKQQVEAAKKIGADLALSRQLPGIEKIIHDFTDGAGVDAVIITAGSSSTDPVELAGGLCRKKGKVVIVGAVPTGFSRARYYKKELDLRLSCSYGPGRYDPNYEEKGQDYPIGYVRWTENRNMKAFVDLLTTKKIELDPLITHSFKLEDAPQAYQMILEKSEPFLGIVLEYDEKKELKKRISVKEISTDPLEPAVGLIGAGSFAQNMLLPAIKKANLGKWIGLADAQPHVAKHTAEKYGFLFSTGSADEILDDDKINTVFIATRHNTHADFVLKAIQKNKNIFVEKPLCLKPEELDKIKEAYSNYTGQLMVDFNRRFSPHIKTVKELFPEESPKAMNFRINAGYQPPDHWVHDPEIGGGRIIGEVCHFIDLALFVADSEIKTVYANGIDDPNMFNDTLSVQLSFANGSIASISYFSNGHSKLAKEFLEIFCHGQVAAIDDFKTMNVYGNKLSKNKLPRKDKGHSCSVAQFLNAVKKGIPSPISFDQIYAVTSATFGVLESLKTQNAISI